MKSSRLGGASIATALCLSLVLAPSPAAQQLVPLGYGVPKDTHLYIHGVASQSPDPGMVAFERAMHHLVESRVHEDLLELATMDLRPPDRQKVRATVEHVLGLLGRVDWQGLMAREVVFAEKLTMPMPEFLMIFRAPATNGDGVAGVKSMLAGFAVEIQATETPHGRHQDLREKVFGSPEGRAARELHHLRSLVQVLTIALRGAP